MKLTAKRQIADQVIAPTKMTENFEKDAFSSPSYSKGLQNLVGSSGQLTSILTSIKKDEQNSLLKKISTKEISFRSDMLNHKDGGYLTLKGQNAISKFNGYSKDYDSFEKDTLETIKDDEVRERAKQLFKSGKQQYLAQMNRHASLEGSRYADQVDMELNQKLTEDSINNYNVKLANSDESVLTSNIDKIHKSIDQMAERKGLPPATVARLKQEAESNIHKGVAFKLVDEGDAQGAKQYLELLDPSHMTEKDKRKVSPIIKRAYTNEMSVEVANEVFKKELSYQDSITSIRKEKNPDIMRAALREFKTMHQERRLAKQQIQIDHFEKRGDDAMQSPKSFKLTSNDYDTMTFSQQQQLENIRARALNSSLGGSDKIKTDFATFDMLAGKIANNEPIDISKYSDRLSLTDLKKLSSMKRDNSFAKNIHSENAWLKDMAQKNNVSKNEMGKFAAHIQRQLERYPKKDRHSQKTRDTVIKNVTREYENTLWGTTPAWRLTKEEKHDRTPIRPPEKKFKNATWFDVISANGVRRMGWKIETPAGTQRYTADGRTLYNTRKPKEV